MDPEDNQDEYGSFNPSEPTDEYGQSFADWANAQYEEREHPGAQYETKYGFAPGELTDEQLAELTQREAGNARWDEMMRQEPVPGWNDFLNRGFSRQSFTPTRF